MANTIDEQLSAYGVAQVVVVLANTAASATGKMPAALVAATPVATSRKVASADDDLVMRLSKYFMVSEWSTDSALAANAQLATKAGKTATSGMNWYRRARSQTDPTPAMRYFPNLGLMLGTVDAVGLKSLRAESHVTSVTAPPTMSLIKPIARSATKPKKEPTWGIRQLKADRLHAKGITGNGIVVGHLDTGADGNHSALKSAFHSFAEFDDLGFEVTPSPAPHDTADHGTHTAGTIAGRTVGGRAIGMAPEALLASAIVIEGGNVNARILAGMDWIIGQGAHILSMSLGIRGFTEDFLPLTQILRSRGVLPVFAAGNEGPGTSRSPGNYSEALSVGAMASNLKVASFSSSREFNRPNDPIVPDLVAPGVGIVSAMPGGGYQEMDGTSMATPHVAGLAALLMQANPSATIDEVENAIVASCKRLKGEPSGRQNHGVPDAVKALALLP